MTSKSSGLETFSGKLNEQAVFWTNERLREALASPVNSEIDSLTINKNRIRRSEADEFVWTEDALRSAVPIDNDRLSEALRQLGIYPSEMPPSGTEPSPKQIADVNEYPYNNFGKLFVSDSRGSHHCTAAFIRERILITAAHCVKHANGDVYDHIRFYQRFNGMEDQGRIVEVEQIFIPPSYIDEHGMIDLR